MQRSVRLSPILALVFLAACGESATPPPSPAPALTYHRDVEPLVQEKCGGCHVEGGIAPFPLQRYAEVYEMRGAVKAAVKTRLMPPWQADSSCAEYAEDRSLDDEEIALLTRWVDEGGVEGDPSEAPASLPRSAQGGLPRVDLELAMPEAYSPTRSPDEYRCFVLDWPEAQERYVTGFVAQPGRPSIVHHIIAFLILPGDVSGVQARDAAEPGPGYTCFGGPGGDATRASWLGAWAPGGHAPCCPRARGSECPWAPKSSCRCTTT